MTNWYKSNVGHEDSQKNEVLIEYEERQRQRTRPAVLWEGKIKGRLLFRAIYQRTANKTDSDANCMILIGKGLNGAVGGFLFLFSFL